MKITRKNATEPNSLRIIFGNAYMYNNYNYNNYLATIKTSGKTAGNAKIRLLLQSALKNGVNAGSNQAKHLGLSLLDTATDSHLPGLAFELR